MPALAQWPGCLLSLSRPVGASSLCARELLGRELRISVPNAYFIFCKAECPQVPKLPSAFPCKRVEKRPAGGRALGVCVLRVLDGSLRRTYLVYITMYILN